MSLAFGMAMMPTVVHTIDLATLVAGCLLFTLTGALVAYGLVYSSYGPIKAKQPMLATVSLASGFMWFVGEYVRNGKFMQRPQVWGQCKLWLLWVSLTSQCMFMFSLVMRAYIMHRVFNSWQGISRIRGLVVFGVGVLCVLGFCLVVQLVPGPSTVMPDYSAQQCTATLALRLSYLALLWVVWGLMAAAMWRVRKVPRSYHMVPESIICTLVLLQAILTRTVTETATHLVLSRGWSRMANMWSSMLIPNLVIWVLLAYPVAQSLVNPNAYLQQWRRRIVSELQEYLECSSKSSIDGVTVYAVPILSHNPVEYPRTPSELEAELSDSTICARQTALLGIRPLAPVFYADR